MHIPNQVIKPAIEAGAGSAFHACHHAGGQLMSRIQVSADARLDEGYPERRAAVVRVRTNRGHALEHCLDRALGEPEQPFTQAEVAQKFDLTAGRLYGPYAAEIKERAMSLASLPDVIELNELLLASHPCERDGRKP